MSINAMRGAKETAVKLNLKPPIRLTLYMLADMASPAGVSFPSIETLSRLTGKSERQVKRDLKLLVADEVIEVTYRPGKTAVYIVPIADSDGIEEPPRGVTPMTQRGDTHDTPQAPKGVTPMTQRGDTHDPGGVTPMTQRGDTHDTHNSINSNNNSINKEDPIPAQLINRWIEETKVTRPNEHQIKKAQKWYDVFEQVYNDYGDRGFGLMIDAWKKKNDHNNTRFKTSDPEKIREFLYRELSAPTQGDISTPAGNFSGAY